MMVSFTRFARAASPSTDRGIEKGQLDKRFSALFVLPAQPQNSASPFTDGQNEKSSAETDTESVVRPESKPTRAKMDRRFSTLFMPSAQPSPPSTPPSQDESPWTFPPKPTPSQRKNLKLLFRRIFSSTPSTRDETKVTPFTSEEIGSRLWADLMEGATTEPSVGNTLPPPSSATGQRSHTTVIVLPSVRTSPSRSRPKSGVEIVGILQSSGNKRPDSKFSSITSLPSLQSLSLPTSNCSREGGTVNISCSGLLLLESCIRRIGRGLAHQGISYFLPSFSPSLPSRSSDFQTIEREGERERSTKMLMMMNRIPRLPPLKQPHLPLHKKEKQIQILRRLRPDEKDSLTSSLARIRDGTGRTFLRKAVFLQRSQELCCQINEILKNSRSNSNARQNESAALIEVEDRIFDLLRLLGEDVQTQRELDAGLRRCILGAAAEKKWSGVNGGEKTLVDKFYCFVEARLGVLEGGYGRVEMWVRRMERVERGFEFGRGIAMAFGFLERAAFREHGVWSS